MSSPYIQTKIISKETVKEIQKAVNDWLLENNETVKILTANITRNDFYFTVLILYQTETKPEQTTKEAERQT